jgi:hypothetical protein
MDDDQGGVFKIQCWWWESEEVGIAGVTNHHL